MNARYLVAFPRHILYINFFSFFGCFSTSTPIFSNAFHRFPSDFWTTEKHQRFSKLSWLIPNLTWNNLFLRYGILHFFKFSPQMWCLYVDSLKIPRVSLFWGVHKMFFSFLSGNSNMTSFAVCQGTSIPLYHTLPERMSAFKQNSWKLHQQLLCISKWFGTCWSDVDHLYSPAQKKIDQLGA